MYDLPESDSGREWIEVYNKGSFSVNLADWRFQESGIKHQLSEYQGGLTLNQGSYAIIADNPSGFLVDNPGFSGIIIDSSFSLSNTGETLTLLESVDATLSSDEVVYQNSWGACGNGSSLERKSPAGSSNDSGNWQESITGGTPGFVNSSGAAPSSTPTPTSSPTSEPSPSSTPSTGIYQINEVKDADGTVVSSVMIYVDGEYLHHYAPETLTFCDGCTCDTYVNCDFGTHTISLEKSGYEDWSETISINAGNSYEVSPVMDLASTSTLTPTPTKKPTASPTATPELISDEEGEDESLVLGLREKLDPEFSEDAPQEEIKRKFPILAIFLILGGTGLVGFAAYSFLKGKKKGYNIKRKQGNGKEEFQE